MCYMRRTFICMLLIVMAATYTDSAFCLFVESSDHEKIKAEVIKKRQEAEQKYQETVEETAHEQAVQDKITPEIPTAEAEGMDEPSAITARALAPAKKKAQGPERDAAVSLGAMIIALICLFFIVRLKKTKNKK